MRDKMKKIFDQQSQSIADSFHNVHDFSTFRFALISSAPSIKDEDAAIYLTLAKSAIQNSDFGSIDNQDKALNVIIASTKNTRLGWLAQLELANDFETLKNAVTKTAESISNDRRANFYMNDLQARMHQLGFDLNPNTEKEDRDAAATTFAVLYGAATNVTLKILAASEVGARVGGDNKKLWAKELLMLNQEKLSEQHLSNQP